MNYESPKEDQARRFASGQEDRELRKEKPTLQVGDRVKTFGNGKVHNIVKILEDGMLMLEGFSKPFHPNMVTLVEEK